MEDAGTRLRTGVSATDGEHFVAAAFDVPTVAALAAEKGARPASWPGLVPTAAGITQRHRRPRTVEQLADNLGALEVRLAQRTWCASTAASPPEG